MFLYQKSSLDIGSIEFNDFSDNDREQFIMLLGHSVAFFNNLRYVSNDTIQTVNLKKEREDELTKENEKLKEELDSYKSSILNFVDDIGINHDGEF